MLLVSTVCGRKDGIGSREKLRWYSESGLGFWLFFLVCLLLDETTDKKDMPFTNPDLDVG